MSCGCIKSCFIFFIHCFIFFFFSPSLYLLSSEERCVRLLLIHLMFLKLSKTCEAILFLVHVLHHFEHLNVKVYYLPLSKFWQHFFFLFRSVPFSSHFNLAYSVYIFSAQNFEFFMYEIVFRQNPYALICCL